MDISKYNEIHPLCHYKHKEILVFHNIYAVTNFIFYSNLIATFQKMYVFTFKNMFFVCFL